MRTMLTRRPLSWWLRLVVGVSPLIGIFYWLYLDRGSRHTSTLSPIQLPDSCLADLLSAFGISESRLDHTVPIYATLSQAKAVSESCQHSVAAATSWGAVASPPAGFRKPELLNDAEQHRIYDIVQQLHSNFSLLGLELFLEGGSLLGSVRHLGFIPWDADVDVMIRISQKSAVRQLLMDLSSSDEYRFVDTEKSLKRWQLGILCRIVHNEDAKARNSEKQCKTLVNFYFGHVENSQYKQLGTPYLFYESFVYPLGVRPFGSHLLPVPNKPELFLAAIYGRNFETKCMFKYFKNKTLDCSSLSHFYPFVKHLVLPHGNKQFRVDLLVQNNKMQSLFIPK